MTETTKGTQPGPWGIPLNVWVLGGVSFLTDVSSEMTLTILPLFLSNVLGVTTAFIGIIEGIAETTASLTRVFSGWLSDRLGSRKELTLLGYGLSAFSKPLLYFAGTWGFVLAVRFADRLGKGVRTAPRDALIADSTPAERRALSFGLHRAADTAGAFVGLALVALIVYMAQRMELSLERATFQTLILVAVVPGFLAVLLLLLFVKERERVRTPGPLPSLSLKGFGKPFKWFLGASVFFTLGNSSDAFLILRAQNLGLTVLQIAFVLVLFNFVYSVAATPFGALADRWGKERLLVGGWCLYGLVYLGFATAGRAWQVWPLYGAYGIYYAMAEGVGRALVADLVSPGERGTAYGVYHATLGVVNLPASIVAGLLWQGLPAFGGWRGFGPGAPFLFGAVLAFLAAALLSRLPQEPKAVR